MTSPHDGEANDTASVSESSPSKLNETLDGDSENVEAENAARENAGKANIFVQWVAALASIAICVWVGNLLVTYYKDWSVLQKGNQTIPVTISRSQFIVKFATIPTQEIVGGGVGIDGIPSLTDPALLPNEDAQFVRNDNRVIGVVNNGESVAFPIRVMSWHEIVNLAIGGRAVAVTYCPLCDSAVVFDRIPAGETTPIELGVSGLLFNNNVLMYDRADGEDSLWSQMMTVSVSGPMSDKQLEVLPCELTSWKSWKKRHPNTKVLSLETGHERDYRVDPYLAYSETENLNFGVNHESSALPRKKRVLGVWSGDESRCYTVDSLGESDSITDAISGKSYKIVADRKAGSLRIEDYEE
ncbi:MAG: hypothetical protein ACI9HK_000898, partial [Pirellulaceae bacterium]